MRAFLLLVLLAIPFQRSMAQKEKKQTAVLNHIAVYVADLQKATDFYHGIFDLEIIPEPFKDGRHTWFTLGPAGQLHLIQGAKASTVHDKNEHLCFSVPSIETFIKKLNSKNINFEDWGGTAKGITNRADGIKQVYFKDPDGHWLEVNDDK
ncbi:VOC family protein [Pedobacter psychroterrae]|nr:VOC family protein [Pedobacter psychroterrae]